jgi:hypothetical protein
LTAPEWSESGGIKVERAEKHIGDLDDAVAAFMEKYPYSARLDLNKESGTAEVVIGVARKPPPYLGAIAGDAIHNMRSALDCLWRNAWYPGGGGWRDYGCAFPIFDSSDQFEARFRSVTHGRKKRIVDLARAFRPYKGGNDDLWGLGSVNDLDKHRILIPAFTALSEWSFSPAGRHTMTMFDGTTIPVEHVTLTPQEPIFPVEDGTVLIRGPISAVRDVVDMNPQLTLQVAFGEGEMVKGKPMVPTLYRFLDLVQKIAEAYLAAGIIK